MTNSGEGGCGPNMNYWFDLFTGTTWEEFRQAGARITGFRQTTRNVAKGVKPGDIFLCYLTEVMRWVGALEVVAPSADRTRKTNSDSSEFHRIASVHVRR